MSCVYLRRIHILFAIFLLFLERRRPKLFSESLNFAKQKSQVGETNFHLSEISKSRTLDKEEEAEVVDKEEEVVEEEE